MIETMVFFMLLSAVPLAIFWRVRSFEQQWHPLNDETTRTLIRQPDVPLLLSILAPLMLFLAFDARTPEYVPYFASFSVAEPIRQSAQMGVITIAVVTLAAIGVTVRKGAGSGSLVAGFGIAITALLTNIALSNAHDVARKDHTGNENYRVRFELPDHVDGAEIEINGVKMGPLPLEITVRDMFQKIGRATQLQLDELDSDDTHATTWVFDENGMHGPGSWQWQECRLDLSMTSGPRTFPGNYPDTVKVRITVDDEFGLGTNTVSCLPTRDGCRCVIPTRFPTWEKKIKALFDQARMSDYVVDDDWLHAYESWKWWGWNFLERHVEQEPKLASIIEQLAQRRYDIRGIVTAEAAWAVLGRIGDEAVASQCYETFSVRGSTVELLLPMIDKQELFEHVRKLIAAPLFPPSMTQGCDRSGKRHRFYVGTRQDDAEALHWAPFFHACWKQHEKEKASNGQKETSVQAALASVFIQAEGFEPGYSRFTWAARLEGKIFEEFLLRQKYMASDDRSFYGMVAEGVNRWFATLITLHSPRGKRFRWQHQETLLNVASRGLEEAHGMVNEVPGELSFLFIDEPDRENSCLAISFWPALDGFASAIPGDGRGDEALDLRLDYLSKMWPVSTNSMFVEAMLKVPDQEYFNPRRIEGPDAGMRFQIFTAVMEALQKRQTKYRKHKNAGHDTHSTLGNKIQKLNSRRMNLVCREAAAVFVDYWAAKSDYDTTQLRTQMAVDSIHDHHVEALAKHKDKRLRAAALPAIRNHPTVRRMKVLSTLQSDSDDTVRVKAAALTDQLDELANAALQCPLEIVP